MHKLVLKVIFFYLQNSIAPSFTFHHSGDSGLGAQWVAPDLHDEMQKSRYIVLSFGRLTRVGGLGAAWILWLWDEYGSFEKVSYGGRLPRNASAMPAECETLRMGIEHFDSYFDRSQLV